MKIETILRTLLNIKKLNLLKEKDKVFRALPWIEYINK